MKDIIIIKNSNTLLNNDVYFPDSNDVEYGELILNNSANKETLFIKNDSNAIIPFRSKSYTLEKIDSTKPTVTVSETMPVNAKEGDFWVEPIPPVPLQLEYTTSIINESITLPLKGNVTCAVNWGDGSETIVNTDNPTHTYNQAGVYNVSISGHCNSLYHSSTNITKVIAWGDEILGLTSLEEAFIDCINLSSIPTDIAGVFEDVTTFRSAFQNCNNLSSIPNNLFDYAIKAIDFSYTFQGGKVFNSIPNNLFLNNIEVTDFSYTFAQCPNIEHLPSGLFVHCPKVTSFEGTFLGCAKLITIPKSLFENNPEVITFKGVFNGCDSINTISAGLFKYNTKVTTFEEAFMSCENLTSIPSTLFSYNTEVINFSKVFAVCTKLTQIPVGLFNSNTKVTTFNRSFYFCTLLNEPLNNSLFSSNINVTDFGYTFNNCLALLTIPTTLFDNNKKVINFEYTFAACPNLIGDTPSTNGLKLWERAGQSGYPSDINGTRCFCEDVNLDNYKKIPGEWRCDEIFPIYPLILEYVSFSSNQPIITPLFGNVNCTIDWGDDSEIQTLTNNNPHHYYRNPGTYIVSITGTCDSLVGGSKHITKVISWGDEDFGYTNLNGSFTECTNLSSIPNDDHKAFKNVTSFIGTFSGCTSLIGQIPENLFNYAINAINFTNTFGGCTGLTGSIPENLFVNCPNVTTFAGIFHNCRSLTGSIPENLFSNCPNVTSFNSTFNLCYNLTGSIPENLFKNCPNVTTFVQTFRYCHSLTGSMPENLFDNNKNVTNFSSTFYQCSGLTGNTPTGTDGIELWDRAGQPGYPASIQGNGCFEGCTKLTNYVDIPRAWKQYN